MVYVKFEDSGIDGATIFADKNHKYADFYFSTSVSNINANNNSITNIQVFYNPFTGIVQFMLKSIQSNKTFSDFSMNYIYYI